jgi:hypothetical protein
MPDTSKLDRLERLADIQEMRDALTRYCRGTDRVDFELASSAFWPDSTEDHGPYKGTSHDFIKGIMPVLREQYEQLYRYTTNFTVEFHGEQAESETYWCAILRDATLDLFQVGRYLDRWERRKGEWKIAARVAVIDWWRQDPRNTFPFPHKAQEIARFTRRGLEDPEIRKILRLG